MDLSETFKVLGDETRLRILNLISRREICVCLIEEVLGIMQPNASKHISRLKASGIIEYRKVSQWCFFRISDDFIKEYGTLYDFLKNKWNNGSQYIQDTARLHYLITTNDCCRELLQKSREREMAAV
jgi:ArsR family transcriptional regulator, arsenate/arsenite/antimonite-responsive transcriptional repressor